MSLSTKKWVTSLFQKLNNKGAFFDVYRLKNEVKTSDLYITTATDWDNPNIGKINDILLGTIPSESAGGDVTFYINRSSVTFSGSGYPKADLLLNDIIINADMELIANTPITIKFKASKDDKIILRYKETRAEASITRYYIKLSYTGDYFSYGGE